jgi:hypothetical protein
VRYTDPSGHRSCTAEQAATGNESCDQNYDTDDLKQGLEYLYGWTIVGDWSVEQLMVLADAGKSIREYVNQSTGKDGNLWIKSYTGSAVFHPGNQSRSFVFPSHDIYLVGGEDKYTVIHELAHVLDNHFSSGSVPATILGGGAADEMLKAVGGNPETCVPRFQCSADYDTRVAGSDPWPGGSYGNNSVADDFADTFTNVTTGRTTPYRRTVWMTVFIILLATYLP